MPIKVYGHHSGLLNLKKNCAQALAQLLCKNSLARVPALSTYINLHAYLYFNYNSTIIVLKILKIAQEGFKSRKNCERYSNCTFFIFTQQSHLIVKLISLMIIVEVI